MSLGNLLIQLPYGETLNVVLLLITVLGFALSTRWMWQRLQARAARQRAVVCGNGLAWLLLLLLLCDIQWRAVMQQTLVLQTTHADRVDDDALQAAISGAEQVANSPAATHWLRGIEQASHVILVGDGLTAAQWRLVQQSTDWQNKRFSQIPSQQMTGLYNAHWQSSVRLGASVTLSFAVAAGAEQQSLYRVELLDPTGAVMQEQLVQPNAMVTMQWQPQSQGNWLYEVRVYADRLGQTSLASEQIAVAVLPAEPLQVLILQSAPSFATRHLQNYLVDRGAQVKVVSQISKKATRIQQFNQRLPSNAGERIQLPEDLAHYDVALLDWRAFTHLEQTQRDILSAAVRGGLGLHIWLSSEALQSADWQDVPAFGSETLQSMREDYSGVLPVWQSLRASEPMAYVSLTLPTQNVLTAVRATTGEPLVVLRAWMNGQVGLSLLPNTYVMQTTGETERYSDYWANLLNLLARPEQAQQLTIGTEEPVHTVNAPFSACIHNAETELQLSVLAQETAVVLPDVIPDQLDPQLQCTLGWGGTGGWQKLALKKVNTEEGGLTLPFYVYPDTAWLAWRQHDALSATAQVVEQTAEVTLPTDVKYQPIRKEWLWAVWLLLVSALWLERKRF